MVLATLFVAACGGGGDNISPALAVEAIPVVKINIAFERGSASREVALAVNAGATVVAANVRCISFFDRSGVPPGAVVPQIQTKALIFDVSPADIEKLKGLGYRVFNAPDFSPFFPEPC